MKLGKAIFEAINMSRVGSFPVFTDERRLAGRIYLVTSEEIEFISEGSIDNETDYVVYLVGDPDNATENDIKYYSADPYVDDITEVTESEKVKLISSFGRAWGFLGNLRRSDRKT